LETIGESERMKASKRTREQGRKRERAYWCMQPMLVAHRCIHFSRCECSWLLRMRKRDRVRESGRARQKGKE